MAELHYPTAINVLVFANGIHIDQAYRIDIKDEAPLAPLYGYNDYSPSVLMRGRNLVQGFLVTNFVYPGYLSTLMQHINNNAFAPYLQYPTRTSKVELKDFVVNAMPPNTPETREARATFIANLFDKKATTFREASFAEKSRSFGGMAMTSEQAQRVRDEKVFTADTLDKDQIKKLLLEQFTESRLGSSSPVQAQNPVTMAGEMDLDVYYREPAQALWYVSLKGVKFSSASQTISSAGMDGSSENLYEVCEFMAKRRDIINLA